MSLVLSILVLATIALLIGAILVWRRGGPRKQAILMLVLAIVAAGNVAIWTWPDSHGAAPIGQAPR